MVEYVYHVDEDDHVIGKVTRKEMRAKGLLHRVVVIFVFNSKHEILVMKRTMTKDKDPGMYETNVAGTVTFGENYMSSAKRELKEETSIIAEPKQIFNVISGDAMVRAYTIIHDGPLKLQESEVDKAYFVPFEELEQEMEKHSYRKQSYDLLKKYNEKSTGTG